MSHIDELLKSGIIERYQVPLSLEGDFLLTYSLIKHRDPSYNYQRKVYLISLYIEYAEQKIVENIVEYEGFIAGLRLFSEKRNFPKETLHFTEKTKDGATSLQLNIDTKRYITTLEATQMLAVIYGAFIGISKSLLYQKYMVQDGFYISPELDKEYGHREMIDTEVLDIKGEQASDS